MPIVAAGVLLLVLLLLLARGYTGAKPRSLARGFRLSGGVLTGFITVALLVTGRAGFAFLTAGVSWYLLFGTLPPWQRVPGGPANNQNGTRTGPPQTQSMSRTEALKVLGLREGSGEKEIRDAHRRLIQQIHPDKGGTDYLAAKINEAKDVLLKG